MINDAHVDQCQAFHQAFRNVSVGGRGFGNAGRVVVIEDQGGSVQLQGALYYDPGVDRGGVHRALEQLLVGDQPVLAVQEEDTEDFAVSICELQAEVVPGGGRAAHRFSALKSLAHDVRGQGQHIVRAELATGDVFAVGFGFKYVHENFLNEKGPAGIPVGPVL